LKAGELVGIPHRLESESGMVLRPDIAPRSLVSL
jgi:hypothetical protein